jgi:hypothetical protein
VSSAPESPEKSGSERREKTEKIAEGAAPLIIAVLALISQIRGNYSGWWTALVVLLCVLGFGLLFVRWRHRFTSGVERKIWISLGWLSLVGGILTLTLAPQTQSSGSTSQKPAVGPGSTAGTGEAAAQGASVSDSLKTLLTVPDETGSCSQAGALTKDSLLRPGAFAITPGTQVSVLMQGSLSAKIVVTHIRTIIDGHPAKFGGVFEDLTNPCQGEQDEEYYIADFSGSGGDVSYNPAGKKSDDLPITVSSDDPVSVYIVTPTSLPGIDALSWHVEITWVFQGTQYVTKVYNDGHPIVVSTR